MTDTTPLPCPLCGGDKVLISQTLDQVGPNWFAACHRAACAFTGYSLTEAEALTAWNTRANADARLVEALRGLAGNAGALKAFEWEIREVCGNTNWQCLMDAIAKAGAALSEVSQ